MVTAVTVSKMVDIQITLGLLASRIANLRGREVMLINDGSIQYDNFTLISEERATLGQKNWIEIKTSHCYTYNICTVG